MMYAKGNDFIKDFAARTKENLTALSNGPYEVTQLISSTVGLLIFPEQKQFNRISDSLIDTKLLDCMKNSIVLNTYRKPINLQEICRHMRNAISHSSLEFEAEKPVITTDPLTVNSVIFKDTDQRSGEHIKIKITIDLLREFLFSFSDAIVNLP